MMHKTRPSKEAAFAFSEGRVIVVVFPVCNSPLLAWAEGFEAALQPLLRCPVPGRFLERAVPSPTAAPIFSPCTCRWQRSKKCPARCVPRVRIRSGKKEKHRCLRCFFGRGRRIRSCKAAPLAVPGSGPVLGANRPVADRCANFFSLHLPLAAVEKIARHAACLGFESGQAKKEKHRSLRCFFGRGRRIRSCKAAPLAVPGSGPVLGANRPVADRCANFFSLHLPLAAVEKIARHAACLGFESGQAKKEKHRSLRCFFGRGRRIRTLGTRFWRPLLYQLSYTPMSLEQNLVYMTIF